MEIVVVIDDVVVVVVVVVVVATAFMKNRKLCTTHNFCSRYIVLLLWLSFGRGNTS